MHYVKFNDGRKLSIYDTFNELLNRDIEFIRETSDNYYIRLVENSDPNDGTMYKVDKTTKKVSFIDIDAFILLIEDSTIETNLNELKRNSKSL